MLLGFPEPGDRSLGLVNTALAVDVVCPVCSVVLTACHGNVLSISG
jgi:hypothetical protein